MRILVLNIIVILTHWALGMSFWFHRFWSSAVHVMVCCLKAPIHNLNQFGFVSWTLTHLYLNEILFRIQEFSFKKKNIWEMLCGKYQPFCLGLNWLIHHLFDTLLTIFQKFRMHLYNPLKASKILLLILSMSSLSFLLGIYFYRPS